MRHATGSVLIRSLRDIRLSRLSMVALAALSLAATVFILAGGSDRSTAQLAALAALHQRPVTVTQTTPATPAPPAAAAAAADIGAGGGGGADSSLSSGAADTPSADAGATSVASSSASAPADSGGGADTSTTTTTTSSSTSGATSALPKVRHVFEIVLSTPSYADVFGHGSAAPYLHSLEAKGTLLTGYESLGEGELADELAAVGGQEPNADTRAGCTTYTEFRQGVTPRANGTVPGAGCVYPEAVLTVGDQVSAAGHTWKAYIAGLGSATCAHPNSGAVDNLALTGTQPDYDTRHNPFIYFHSLLDLGDCATDDVDVSHLDKALASTSRTPAYTFLAPGACADASAVEAPAAQVDAPTTSPTATTSTTTTSTTTATSGPASTTTGAGSTTTTGAGSTTTAASPPTPSGASSACPAGRAVGIAAEDAFLKQWVPQILGSPAYRADGVLIIAFAGDAAKNPGHPTRTGALVLSRYARRHRTLSTAYGPYSLLRSVEDMLGFSALARAKSVSSFASNVLVSK